MKNKLVYVNMNRWINCCMVVWLAKQIDIDRCIRIFISLGKIIEKCI